jgi:hypothetical protein
MDALARLDMLEEAILSDLKRDSAGIAGAILAGNLAGAFISQPIPGGAIKIKTGDLSGISMELAEALHFKAEERWQRMRASIVTALKNQEHGH